MGQGLEPDDFSSWSGLNILWSEFHSRCTRGDGFYRRSEFFDLRRFEDENEDEDEDEEGGGSPAWRLQTN